MATKKQRRTDEVRHKKTRKSRRVLLLSVIIVVSVVFLAIFFITLFDYIYPPATGKHTAAKKRDKQEVTLFFSDANERFLVPEKRFIPKESGPEEQAQEMVKALLSGSKTGLVNTFPENAELQSVKMEGGDTLLVNFREISGGKPPRGKHRRNGHGLFPDQHPDCQYAVDQKNKDSDRGEGAGIAQRSYRP